MRLGGTRSGARSARWRHGHCDGGTGFVFDAAEHSVGIFDADEFRIVLVDALQGVEQLRSGQAQEQILVAPLRQLIAVVVENLNVIDRLAVVVVIET